MSSNFQDMYNLSYYDSNATIIENLTVDTINALDNTNITVNANITIPNTSRFIGNLTGNADTSTNFLGSLSGDIIGTQSTTQIAPGVIINSDISNSAGISDNKLAIISSSGKIANSATTATSSNTDGTIVLQNNTTGTSFGSINTGNITMNTGYNNINMTGGNSTGYLFGAYNALYDGIHLTYNNVYWNNSPTITIPSAGGCTSRVTVGYGTVSLCAGNVNVAPTEYLRVDYSKNISALNGAQFIGSCSGSIGTFTTLNCTTLTAPTCYFSTLYGISSGDIIVNTNIDCGTYNISAVNAIVNNVTTSSGDLNLNPVGSNIQCNSKNLTAVNTIAVNSNGVMRGAVSILSGSLSYLTSLTIGRIGYHQHLVL